MRACRVRATVFAHRRGITVRTFSCFTRDDRYTAPTLQFFFAADEERARLLARRQLMESDHHLAVEVHENGEPLFREERGIPPMVAEPSAGPAG